jgi:hypothetical protein
MRTTAPLVYILHTQIHYGRRHARYNFDSGTVLPIANHRGPMNPSRRVVVAAGGHLGFLKI